jgi:hypothetical protein
MGDEVADGGVAEAEDEALLEATMERLLATIRRAAMA